MASRGRSFMNMMAESKAELDFEADEETAHKTQRRYAREAAEREAKLREDEEEGYRLAQSIETIQNDEVMAMKMQALERQESAEWEKEQAAQREEDEAMAKKIDEHLNKQERKARQAGEKKAAKMQKREIKAFLKRKRELEKAWSQPNLEVDDIEDGILITVGLPELKNVEVSLDADARVVIVHAVPDDGGLHEEARNLGEDISLPKAIRFAVDLRVVGGVVLTDDDVDEEYSKKTGKLKITVRNVELSEDFEKERRRKFTLEPLKSFARRFLRK